MNWYFENHGISQGPFAEALLAMRVQAGEVTAHTLVWHPGMEEWQPVAQLRPDWLRPIATPTPTETSALRPSADRPSTKPLAPSTTKEAKQGFFSKLFGRGKKK